MSIDYQLVSCFTQINYQVFIPILELLFIYGNRINLLKPLLLQFSTTTHTT